MRALTGPDHTGAGGRWVSAAGRDVNTVKPDDERYRRQVLVPAFSRCHWAVSNAVQGAAALIWKQLQ